MKGISVSLKGIDLDFQTAEDITKAVARRFNPDTSLMAWFDRKQNKHSPSQVECDAENLPGWEEYGRHHGGKWKIAVNDGEYVFIYT
jgi:hypothetical protein